MPDIKQVLAEAARRVKQRKLWQYQPYIWQQEFHDAGGDNQERMLMAANRVGKTHSAGYEVACHATGIYPDWWKGKRFTKPVLVWTGAVTNEASRDIVQKELLGGTGEELGTGYIPKDNIIGKPAMRQAGVSDVVDTVKVRHKAGTSTVIFKTYDQGWRKWQGAAPDVIWLDEEPDDYRLFTEAQTRILTSRGILLVTFTPLLGETELVLHFMNPKAPGIYLKTATWDDAPHLSEEDKARLNAAYPDYELDARTKGIPMMGEGRVFPLSEEEIKIEPFPIPAHFARIAGHDFGIAHPAGTAWIAWDRDRDIIYVTDCYRKSDETPPWHAEQINRRGRWIPVAWPHDGHNRDKGSGTMLKDLYLKAGVHMLGISARYDSKKGGAQPVEPIVTEFSQRMQDGRLKVFSTCKEWFEEFRGYHRKDGRIVDVRDDVLKASFYAVMMKRYAVSQATPAKRQRMGAVL